MTVQRTLATALLSALLAAACSAQDCPGGPTVVFPNGGGTSTCEFLNDRYNITITLTTAAFDVIIIVQANTNQDIKWIQIRTDPGERGLLSVYGANPSAPAGPIGSIYQEGDGPVTLVRVLTTGPMGAGIGESDPAIHVDKLSFLHVQGDVYKRIEVSEDKLLAATIDGDLLGDVIVPNSWIKSLVVGGSIGSPSAPVNIWTKNALDFMSCQDLYANIDTTLYSVSAGIFELRVESADSSRGNFDGSIRCGYVVDDHGHGTGAFIIDGDVLGEISVDRDFGEDITIGTFSSDDPLFIGEQYEADTLTRFTDPLGLQGQMIINGHNGTYGWLGDVEYSKDGNFVALAPVPYYNNKSDDLGGGAVGLAPFYCYYKDCTPRGTKVDEDASTGYEQLEPCDEGYHAQLRVSPYATSSTVTIRHYGPVKQEGTGKPFEVWSKPINEDPCDGEDWNWGEVTGSFTHSFPSGDPRAIEITGPFADAHDYLIRPETSGAVMLVCDGLTTSNTVPVKDYDYRIRVFYLQNLNMAGGLEAGDIAAWLLDPADTTLDGTTDNDDLIDVIDAVAEYGE